MPRLLISEKLVDLFDRILESVEKHGMWEEYDRADICKAVADEYEEYMRAYIANHADGSKHSQQDELLDLACVAIKGILRLELITRKEQGHGNK